MKQETNGRRHISQGTRGMVGDSFEPIEISKSNVANVANFTIAT